MAARRVSRIAGWRVDFLDSKVFPLDVVEFAVLTSTVVVHPSQPWAQKYISTTPDLHGVAICPEYEGGGSSETVNGQQGALGLSIDISDAGKNE